MIKRKLEIFYLDYWTHWMQLATWFKSELFKPLGLLNEFTWISLLLLAGGIKLNFWVMVVIYVLLFASFIVGGHYYVKTGAQKVSNEIVNKENQQVMEILERLKRIEHELDNYNRR